jgi:hypothetical protein
LRSRSAAVVAGWAVEAVAVAGGAVAVVAWGAACRMPPLAPEVEGMRAAVAVVEAVAWEAIWFDPRRN